MADFTIKASHLDGEGVQVIEHHMVRLWEQRWVTLMKNQSLIHALSEHAGFCG